MLSLCTGKLNRDLMNPISSGLFNIDRSPSSPALERIDVSSTLLPDKAAG